jgi:ATP-dependent DNA helicase RecG
MTGKPKRDEVWDYPLDAVREAIINAVCHRDYTDNADIQIKIHDDSMTIWNPGGLPGGMTMEDFFDPGHGSRPRNKLVAQVFFDLKYVERYGRGIRMILELCRAAGIPAPEFQERFSGFMVTFRKDAYNEEHLRKFGLSERQTKAILHVKEHGKVTNVEYQRMTGVKRRQATYELKELLDRGFLEKVGTVGKGTYYRLSKRAPNAHNAQ